MHKEHALIAIPTTGLMQETRDFEITCTAGDFNDPEIEAAGFSGPIRVKVTAERGGSEIALLIETVAGCDFACDICLAPIHRELNGSYRVFFDCSDSGVQATPDADDDEYRILDSNATEIDLTEDVRETLLLSVPMKVTCVGNPDCRLYSGAKEELDIQEPEGSGSSWKDSLAKLKKKYR
ncbi:YceD family protein [Pelodictyon luteolum]|uniref:DUF177 domain-containing protein n=1 Tax=Chlorobium luteolum (strain DSM 273 / BCRC 81028 / 2530) TaxID=319225 RepID=Q3B6K5_CHLL3|nr:DUF177 domain-containing protein [Pelodictyon luteolum]ABB23026.1 conserved hypothetical protein [Pelodictyon luteolum DSM 273]